MRERRNDFPTISLTGVPFNSIEDLVRQETLKLPLYHRELGDLSVVHPLKAAPDKSKVD